MNASEIGSDDWWRVVQSMPWQEALMRLTDYKAALLESAPVGAPDYIKVGIQVQKVNAEIHRIKRVANEVSWTNAIKNVLPEEWQHAVWQEKRRLDAQVQEGK